jgi:hypothetical protein
MPLCPRCSTSNTTEAARCAKCGVQLPRPVETADESGQLFTLEEGREYPVPTQTFDTENLAQLRMSVEEYLDGADPDETRIWIKHLRQSLREFATYGATQLNQALDVERKLNYAGDFHHDVGYLVRKGTMLCEEGLDRLQEALDQEDESSVMPAFEVFRQGNDHICTALLMISERQELLQEAVARFAPGDDEVDTDPETGQDDDEDEEYVWVDVDDEDEE